MSDISIAKDEQAILDDRMRETWRYEQAIEDSKIHTPYHTWTFEDDYEKAVESYYSYLNFLLQEAHQDGFREGHNEGKFAGEAEATGSVRGWK